MGWFSFPVGFLWRFVREMSAVNSRPTLENGTQTESSRLPVTSIGQIFTSPVIHQFIHTSIHSFIIHPFIRALVSWLCSSQLHLHLMVKSGLEKQREERQNYKNSTVEQKTGGAWNKLFIRNYHFIFIYSFNSIPFNQRGKTVMYKSNRQHWDKM